MKWITSILIVTVSVLVMSVTGYAAPTPPGQPEGGPGGRAYRHASVTKSVHGDGPLSYWLYEPADPTPASAPVVIFSHGWGATNPKSYGAWIEHLVRRGNLVVFPIYQNPGEFRYDTKQVTANAVQAVRAAIATLQGGGHVKPELDKMATVGHSAGGQISANLAALAASAGLPQPKAVMAVQPGKSWAKSRRMVIPMEEMSRVPASTLLLAVAGDQDRLAKDIDAKKIFLGTTQVPLANKDYIILVSDQRGEPPLVANHFCPAAPDERYDSAETRQRDARGGGGLLRGLIKARLQARMKQRQADDDDEDGLPDMGSMDLKTLGRTVDALDYYGLWKPFDALCEAAFSGRTLAQVIDREQLKLMGRWSDGTPVKPLVITDQP